MLELLATAATELLFRAAAFYYYLLLKLYTHQATDRTSAFMRAAGRRRMLYFDRCLHLLDTEDEAERWLEERLRLRLRAAWLKALRSARQHSDMTPTQYSFWRKQLTHCARPVRAKP